MAYLGLARKWRPQTFGDLVGQAHIAQTILSAIRAGRISQGYLFTGTRGIGKTSAARIFAKVLRCQTPAEPGIPCNQCKDCLDVASGNSVDVLEIDGASNNGVDAVREIRENAKYLPATGKHKIYIIDEVHMLTTAAFNALLKTLEEPPAHVIFIFATTDPQKIPATVLSRCQRFDFKRVSEKDLTERLRQICEAENVTITPDALAILAREAEGSMRDAVSLLDQVLSTNDGKITAIAIANSLGLVDKQTILDCVQGILAREPLKAVEAAGKVHLHGFDLKQFAKELLRTLRQILVTKLLSERGAPDASGFLDVSDVDLRDLADLAKMRSTDELDYLFRVLSHGLEDVSRSSVPKMVLDILLIKMAAAPSLVSLGEKKTLANALAASRANAEAPAQHAQPSTIAKTPTAAPKAPTPARVIAGPTTTPAPATIAAATNPSTKVSIPGNSAEGTAWWKSTVAFVKGQKPLIGSILEHMGFEDVREEGALTVITLGHSKDHAFYRDQLQSRTYNDLTTQLLRGYLGRPVKLEYKEVSASRSLEQIDQEQKQQALDVKRKAVLETEAMQAATQLLGGRLERLHITEKGAEL